MTLAESGEWVMLVGESCRKNRLLARTQAKENRSGAENMLKEKEFFGRGTPEWLGGGVQWLRRKLLN